MAERFDVLVIGGGVMGTAAARTLAERGRRTLLLERFEIGHARGSSGGRTRIFRLTYPEPDLVAMARLALGAWRELEDRAGETLLHATGNLELGRAVPELAAALDACGVHHATLSPAMVAERWPGVRLPPGRPVLVQDQGGVCMAERTVRAQARLAAHAGAVVLERTPVVRMSASGFGVDVETEGAAYEAPIAVLSVGAWAPRMLSDLDLPLPLTPTLEQVTYFRSAARSPIPPMIDRDLGAYVVPDPEDPGLFKVGVDRAGLPPVDPDARSFEPDPERVSLATRYAAEHLGPHEPTDTSETCLITSTPDEGFVIDRRGPIVIGSPCSGHGFKFAPLIGRMLADLATAQPTPVPIERFLSNRSVLRA